MTEQEPASPQNANQPPQRPAAPSGGLQDRLDVARSITQLFSLERYAYVSCCGIAVVLLLVNAVMLMREGINATGLTLLFGASGLITVSIGRLIYMWNKLVDLILSEVTK